MFKIKRKMDIKINGLKMPQVNLELLIQVAANQRAQTKLLIELLCKDDESMDDAFAFYNQTSREETEKVLIEIFSRHNDIDLRSLGI